ncbi:MAG: MurR/RpiR family transcriptional regulator [Firmicutes bacterium HGW-Firmicutes-3]|jgi:DNA-binding MurR/RpiR family transcriptional regulator|nr:MAG: MurR/RpiR family transcriptional regulator [Firmicutes bacterium HGW-Firmicutes-3]
MGILLSRLLIILNDEDYNSTIYHIALVLVINFDLICDMTINELAQLCNVSKSTISKFVRIIGFEDYADFRAAAPFKENKFLNKLNYNTNIMGYLEANNFDAYLDIIKRDIENYKKTIDMDIIDELTRDIIKYKIVASFGLMYSETAAIDLQTKLAYNKKFIITKLNDIKQDEFIRDAKEDTLIIIFTNSGNYIKKYQISETNPKKRIFEQTKAKIVVITSNEDLKNDPLVDLCILFKHTSEVQTHAIMFEIISDIIVYRYRHLSKIES